MLNETKPVKTQEEKFNEMYEWMHTIKEFMDSLKIATDEDVEEPTPKKKTQTTFNIWG